MARKTSSYDRPKEFEGRQYTGMKVGRGHHWRYDAGEWVERKVTPDKWEFRYAVGKQRKGRAPEGSGAPVGTSHHWYILAHQTVTKLDANRYSTEMTGVKHKLAHRRAGRDAWSASEAAQRRQLVEILRDLIAELESMEPASAPPPRRAREQVRRARARAKTRRQAA
jgi:hypothetical protein